MEIIIKNPISIPLIAKEIVYGKKNKNRSLTKANKLNSIRERIIKQLLNSKKASLIKDTNLLLMNHLSPNNSPIQNTLLKFIDTPQAVSSNENYRQNFKSDNSEVLKPNTAILRVSKSNIGFGQATKGRFQLAGKSETNMVDRIKTARKNALQIKLQRRAKVLEKLKLKNGTASNPNMKDLITVHKISIRKCAYMNNQRILSARTVTNKVVPKLNLKRTVECVSKNSKVCELPLFIRQSNAKSSNNKEVIKLNNRSSRSRVLTIIRLPSSKKAVKTYDAWTNTIAVDVENDNSYY